MEKNININVTTLGIPLWWFISSAFILWGYSTIAPHLNIPKFNYWEIFSMRMALSCIMHAFWQRKD